jgi:hypothetical protein
MNKMTPALLIQLQLFRLLEDRTQSPAELLAVLIKTRDN